MTHRIVFVFGSLLLFLALQIDFEIKSYVRRISMRMVDAKIGIH